MSTVWSLVVCMAKSRVGVRREARELKEPVALCTDSRLIVLGFEIDVC